MTTIVAYASACEGVWIGGDSRAVSEGFVWPEVMRKWVRAGGWRLGVAGNAATIRLLTKNSAALAGLISPEDVGEAIVALLAAAGYRNVGKDDEPGPPNYGQDILLASRDGVWTVGGDGFVSAPAGGFFAGGSGCAYAYGAAHCSARMAMPADNLVRWSLEAAAAFDLATGGELFVERVE